MKIAQSAVQGIGMSTKEIRGSWMNTPNYALAVSLLFTRATNQRIMLGTKPSHVLSTSLLCNSLLHDSRFMQVPMSYAAPGDIVVQSGLNPEGYAGIVVDHGRIVSDSGKGVQNNCSLVETRCYVPPASLFRYIGVQKHPGYSLALLANAGFNPDEPRLPAGQPGGGQWTSGGTGGMQMAPSTTALSGVNNWTPGERKPGSEVKDGYADAHGNPHAGGPLTDAQRKLLEQKNAEAAAVIARLGDEGENPDTPESILNGPLKSVWGLTSAGCRGRQIGI